MHRFSEPLVGEEVACKGHKDHVCGKASGGFALGFLTACVLGLAVHLFSLTSPHVQTTSMYGPSAGCAIDSPTWKPFTIDELRDAVKNFVDSLSDDIKNQTYYPDASKQMPQWRICTIVQQCLVPKYGLPISELSSASRTKLYSLFAIVLSDESYKRSLLQQQSNLLLGEMQTWATSCAGTCHELKDPNGLLPMQSVVHDELDTLPVNVSYDGCAKLANASRFVLWSCTEIPRMLHQANIDTQTGRYYLGNVFKEPEIHARNHSYDFVEVYGSLQPGEPFGFRYSGHHFDLSYQIDRDGAIKDLPAFLGHNPLIVAQTSPPERFQDKYVQWRNMRGVPQFPDAIMVVLASVATLTNASFVPLKDWDSTPENGGLTLKGGKDITDVAHLNLSEVDELTFEKIWNLIDYTLELSRGARPRPEKAAFRVLGKLVWTSISTSHLPRTMDDLVEHRAFFYVRVETPDLLYFCMINGLFALMLENEPQNHLHSILIPKSYLANLR